VLAPIVSALGRVDRWFGGEAGNLERSTELLLRFIDVEGQSEVREWFEGIHNDQGAIIQLTPESMDIFNAGVEDNADLRYGCVVARAPAPVPIRVAPKLRSPVNALSAAVFSSLYVWAGRTSRIYPPPSPSPEARLAIEEAIGKHLDNSLSDGLVPTASMIWGEVLWAGIADHLDVLGHFSGESGSEHTDWIVSGADFAESDFEAVMDAIANHQLGGRPTPSEMPPY
jgi:triacylglycerol lipase